LSKYIYTEFVIVIWEGAAFEEDGSIYIYLKINDVKNNFKFPMTPTWKVKWSSTSSRIENYEKDDTINDCKNMESFIVGLGTVQTLKAN